MENYVIVWQQFLFCWIQVCSYSFWYELILLSESYAWINIAEDAVMDMNIGGTIAFVTADPVNRIDTRFKDSLIFFFLFYIL